jgi:hypothetical protein
MDARGAIQYEITTLKLKLLMIHNNITE